MAALWPTPRFSCWFFWEWACWSWRLAAEREAALPPELLRNYLAGAAGLAGVVWVALMPESTERGPLVRWIRTVSPMEVNIKMIAAQVVTLVSRLAAPRGPNAVCEP